MIRTHLYTVSTSYVQRVLPASLKMDHIQKRCIRNCVSANSNLQNITIILLQYDVSPLSNNCLHYMSYRIKLVVLKDTYGKRDIFFKHQIISMGMYMYNGGIDVPVINKEYNLLIHVHHFTRQIKTINEICFHLCYLSSLF